MKSETFVFFNRGDDFRTDYGRLGELRALLPPSVHVMAHSYIQLLGLPVITNLKLDQYQFHLIQDMNLSPQQ